MGKNPLILAAENGNLDKMIYLIGLGYSWRTKNDLALILAARNGHLEIVKCLVQSFANYQAYNNLAWKLSYKFGHFEVFRYLVELNMSFYHYREFHKLSLDEFMKSYPTKWYAVKTSSDVCSHQLFKKCVKTNQVEIIKCLLEAGYEPISKLEILEWSLEYEYNYKSFKYLLNSITYSESDYDDIAYYCLSYDNVKAAKLLILDFGYNFSLELIGDYRQAPNVYQYLFTVFSKKDKYALTTYLGNDCHLKMLTHFHQQSYDCSSPSVFSPKIICQNNVMKHCMLKKILKPMSLHMQLTSIE
jgi:hypothetical protein